MLTPKTYPAGRSSGGAGFTLLELLLAVVLGAVVLVAIGSSAGLFGSQVAEATEDLDTSLEAGLEEISDSVQRALLVEQPTANRLVVTDAAGRTTTYDQDGTTLRVTRPNGSTGVLADDVSKLAFTTETTRRLREATPVDTYGPWYDSAPKGASIPLIIPILGSPVVEDENLPYYDPAHIPGLLQRNDAVSLSFTIPAGAPEAMNTLPDVKEQVIKATLERILLPIAHLSKLPNIPVNFPASSTGKHVEICHYPPGNPRNSQDITIGLPALADHQAHGDSAGNCPLDITDPDPGELLVAIYETAGKDDALPMGTGALAYIKLQAASLPEATWNFTGITYGPIAFFNPQLVIETPTVAVPLDIATLGSVIEPGTPFTMVLAYTGNGCIVLSPTQLVTPVNSGVAARREGEAEFTPQDWDVDFLLDGMRTYTQTAEAFVIHKVNTSIALSSGRSVTGTSLITSQALPSNPWYGQVPGELPTLQLMGN